MNVSGCAFRECPALVQITSNMTTLEGFILRYSGTFRHQAISKPLHVQFWPVVGLPGSTKQHIHVGSAWFDEKKDPPGPESGDTGETGKEVKATEKEKGGDHGGSGGGLRCPKCGSPCTHVETFVLSVVLIYMFLYHVHITHCVAALYFWWVKFSGIRQSKMIK